MRKLKVLFMALAVVMSISVLSGVASAGPLDGYTGKPAGQSTPSVPTAVYTNIVQRVTQYYWMSGAVGHHLTIGYLY